MPKYGIIGRIGQGAQGVLVKARVIETGETVAVKRIQLKNDTKSQIDVLREINCLRHCNHENIVKIIDNFFNDITASIVMEFVDSNLKLVINDVSRPQNDATLAHYFQQIFNGVAYLHHLNIMHRDLKPENILVTLDNKIKIADFGLACVFVPNSKKTYSHQVVTRWYRAPELLFGSVTYDPKVDIWACGCVLAEYVNGSPLFMGYNDIDQLAIVLSVLGTPVTSSWPEWESLPDAHKIVFEKTEPCDDWSEHVPCASTPVCDLITSIIQLNPKHRITALECADIIRKTWPHSPEITYTPMTPSAKRNDPGEIAFATELDYDGIFNGLVEMSL